ncbi:MAG: hypothetical protein H6990_01310 [Pseudomonadales bacterium]|nr:hypothetical protein [Pseudomonadales bacterium]
MPETTYMGVDPRRDHSIRIPRPDLSAAMGTPNACTQCHSDRDPQWAVTAIMRGWGVHFRDTGSHIARAFQRFDQGDRSVVPALAQLANDKVPPRRSGAPLRWRPWPRPAAARPSRPLPPCSMTTTLLRASAVRPWNSSPGPALPVAAGPDR